MTAAHQKQDQARCVACQKPMGEKPPVKNNRQQKINEAAEATKRAHQKGQFIFLVLCFFIYYGLNNGYS